MLAGCRPVDTERRTTGHKHRSPMPTELETTMTTEHDDATPRVVATDAALALIETLAAKHGPLMFHQSGGCCDGSAPMCYPRGDFIVGDRDRRLGHIGGMPFWISGPQYEYWQHTQLIIDVVPGRGGMFSLEGPEGLRFLTRSRLYEPDEEARLVDPPTGAQVAAG